MFSDFELYAREHKTEWDVIYQPSFSGFADYWTNRLFNTDIPPLDIWTIAFASGALASEAGLAEEAALVQKLASAGLPSPDVK